MPITYEVTGLPAGLTYNPETTTIEGTLADGETTIGNPSRTYTITVVKTFDGDLTKEVTFDWTYQHTEEIAFTAGGSTTFRPSLTLAEGAEYTPKWDFGDTNTFEGAVVDHTYAELGTYNGNVRIRPSETTGFSNTNAEDHITFDVANLWEGLEVLNFGGVNTISGDVATLPSTLTQLQVLGSNTLLGDIASLPAGLTQFYVDGANTTNGDIASLPATLTSYNNQGSNTTSGDINGLPATLTSYNNQGSNTTSGDIANLKPALTYYLNLGNNTTTGSIASLPAALTHFENGGTNDTSGDIASLPAGLTSFTNTGSNTTSGDIASLPATLTSYNNQGSNTTSGDIASLPAGLTSYSNTGANTTAGDIAGLPAGLTYFNNLGSNTASGNISGLPVGLTYFANAGANTITGDVATIPITAANTHFAVTGNNTLSGSAAAIPGNVGTSTFQVTGNNTITPKDSHPGTVGTSTYQVTGRLLDRTDYEGDLGGSDIAWQANSVWTTSTGFSATGLPTGLSMNATTGAIEGTIADGTEGNTFAVTVTATGGTNPGAAVFDWTPIDTHVLPFTAGGSTTFRPSLTLDGGAVYTPKWDLGDGNTYNGTAPNHTYAALGTYNGSVRVLASEALDFRNTNSGDHIEFDVADLWEGLAVIFFSGANTINGDLADLPSTLTYFNLQGSNTTSGLIDNLPVGVTVYVNYGSNTTSGNIANLPAVMLIYNNRGSNTATGDIASLSATMRDFYNLGDNTIFGDLANLQEGLEVFDVTGANTTTGDIANLPSTVRRYVNTGSNTTSGDISTLQPELKYYTNWGNSNITATGTTWNGSTTLQAFQQQGVGADQAAVGNMLETLTNVSTWTSGKIVRIDGANAGAEYTRSWPHIAALYNNGVINTYLNPIDLTHTYEGDVLGVDYTLDFSTGWNAPGTVSLSAAPTGVSVDAAGVATGTIANETAVVGTLTLGGDTFSINWDPIDTELVSLVPDSETVELVVGTTGVYEPTIDWGDSNTDTTTGGAGYKKLSHAYGGAPPASIDLRYAPSETSIFNLLRFGDLAGGENVGTIEVLTKADGKGVFDTFDPATLKTDLVRRVDRGSNERFAIDSADAGAFNPGTAVTVAGWVKVESFDSWGFNLLVRWSPLDQRGWEIRITSSGELRFGTATDGTLDTDIYLSTAPGSITVGNWHFVCVRWDGATKYASVDNGTEVSQAEDGIFASSADLELGDGSPNSVFQVSKLGYWDRDLSASERTALYNAGTPRSHSELTASEKVDLVAFWDFEEPRGQAYDASGNGHHFDDLNSVGAAHGPVEIIAEDYAGITKWENQGLAASPFGDVVATAPGDVPQLIAGVPTWDGLATHLQTAVGATTQPFTVIVIAKYNSVVANSHLFDGNGASNRASIYTAGTFDTLFAGTVFNTARATTTDRAFYHALFNGALSSFDRDAATATGDAGTQTMATGCTIGSRYSPIALLDGEIEAVLIIDRDLTAVEKAALNALLVE